MRFWLSIVLLCFGSQLFPQVKGVKNADFVPPLQMVSRVNASSFHYGDTMWVDICVKNVSDMPVGFCRNALTRMDVRHGTSWTTRFLTEVRGEWGALPEGVQPQIVRIEAGQRYWMRYAVPIDNSLFALGRSRMQLYYAYAKVKKKKWCSWGLFDGVCYMEKHTRPEWIVVEPQ